MDFLKQAMEQKDLLIAMRRHLHENPEVSDKEYNTLEYVKGKLGEFGLEYLEVKNGGIVAWVGDEKKGKTVMLRADLDALPVLESPENLKGKRECCSKIDGVMHACGHDGHTAMLLVAAKILKGMEDKLKGKVYLVFERGEEATGNIKYLLRYFQENNITFDAVYGTHLLSTYETGKFSVEPGGVMAGAFVFNYKIIGRGGHGSRPDLSVSPIDCFVQIYNGINALRMKYVSPFNSLTFSVGQLHSGELQNVIPEELTFSGTARFFDRDDGKIFKEKMEELVETTTKAYGCTYEVIRLSEPGFGVINNADLSKLAKSAIAKHLGEQYVGKEEPWMASESFSYNLALYPGVFAFLGMKNPEKGVGAEHHNEKFDIDEDVLPLGSAAAVAYAYEFLNNDVKVDFTPYNGTPMDLLKEQGITFED